jgi:hypothetical protein
MSKDPKNLGANRRDGSTRDPDLVETQPSGLGPVARIRRISANTAVKCDDVLSLLKSRSTNPPKLGTVEVEEETDETDEEKT